MRKQMRKQSGYNLVELMVIVAIVGILAGIAVPNLQSFLNAQVVTSKKDSVVNAFNLARAEALSRLRPVTVEWNSSTTLSIPKGGFSILPGHIAVYDVADVNEPLIKQMSYKTDSISVNELGGSSLNYDASGRADATPQFIFCINANDTSDTNNSYQVNVLVSGQVSVSYNVSSC